MFLKKFTKLTGKHLCLSFFFNKIVGLRLCTGKETLVQVSSYELCEIFKNNFFYRKILVAASVNILKVSKWWLNISLTLILIFFFFWFPCLKILANNILMKMRPGYFIFIPIEVSDNLRRSKLYLIVYCYCLNACHYRIETRLFTLRTNGLVSIW